MKYKKESKIKKLMKKFLRSLISDVNDINEKAIVGFISFLCMVATLIVDLITAWMGRELIVHQFIFNGFLILTLGSFGISSIDKAVSSKNNTPSSNSSESKTPTKKF